MTHAPFIIAAYVIALGTPLVLSVLAFTRRAAARRLLTAVTDERDTR